MKIVNQSRGPIYWSTSFPSSSDCGTVAENANEVVDYPNKEDGTVGIRLLNGSGSGQFDSRSYQRISINTGDQVTVQVLVNGIINQEEVNK